MTQTLPRLISVAMLAWAGLGPAQAALPKHPPAPPARPVFESDADAAPAGAEQAAAQEPAAQAPQAPPQEQEAQTPQPPPQLEAPANYPPPRAPADMVVSAPDESVAGFELAEKAGLADMTREYARRHGVPLALLHRIIMRESRYCPHLVHRRYIGLMQITAATARSMGYHGSAKGLLDPKTNLQYATPYLANAWALADGDLDRAVRLYASGYYYTAKSRHMLDQMRDGNSPPVTPTIAAAQPASPPPPQDFFQSVFGGAGQ